MASDSVAIRSCLERICGVAYAVKYVGKKKTVVLRILPKKWQLEARSNGYPEWIATGPHWERTKYKGKIVWLTTYSKWTRTYKIPAGWS
jgi:hypothetical protein